MFTGIIETTATVISSEAVGAVMKLVLERPAGWDIVIGQSIAVNGVCLTVVSADESSMTFEVVAETVDRTTFGGAIPGLVNLERAMLPTDRFEGHIVQGHIDAVGEVATVSSAHGRHLTLTFDPSCSRLVVSKGSITIDGVSLTITEVNEGSFSVALIPHTIEVTTLGSAEKGTRVNLEFDIIGKYLLHNQNT